MNKLLKWYQPASAASSPAFAFQGGEWRSFNLIPFHLNIYLGNDVVISALCCHMEKMWDSSHWINNSVTIHLIMLWEASTIICSTLEKGNYSYLCTVSRNELISFNANMLIFLVHPLQSQWENIVGWAFVCHARGSVTTLHTWPTVFGDGNREPNSPSN